MTASQVWAIAEDEQGNLWFGSYGDGIYKYNGKQFKQYTRRDGLSDDRIRILCYSKTFHCLIVGSQGGINTIKGETITPSPKEVYNVKIGSCITGVIDAGKFILITSYGQQNPVHYNPDKNEFVILNDKGKHYPDASFSGYISSKGDTVLSLTNKGVRIYEKNRIVQADTLGQVFGITEDNRGNLWIAAWSYQNMELGGGIFRYDGKTFKNFKEAFGISELEIWTVFYDREQDILWIGTETEGLFRISLPFIKYYSASYFHLEHQKINDLYLDSKNLLWISGNRELIQMKPDGTYSLWDKSPMVSAFRKFWNDPRQKGLPRMGQTSLTVKNAHSGKMPDILKKTEFNFSQVRKVSDHSIFYSCELGLFHYDDRSRKTDYLGQEGAKDPFELMGDSIIYCLWGATEINTNCESNRFDYDNSSDPPSPLFQFFTSEKEPKDANHIIKQNDSFWYTSGISGIWMSRGMKLIHFNDYDSTLSKNVNDLCFDTNGHVIFCTNTGEIFIATHAGDKLKIDYRINGDNGLRGTSVIWLLPDSRGNLWASTNEGLNCIDLNELYSKGTYAIRFIDEESGYNGQSSKKAVIDSSGNLWIGVEDQLIQVNTEAFLSNQQQSGKIILRSFEIHLVSVDSLFNTGTNSVYSGSKENFILKHSDNDLTFNYDILNYIDPGEDMFRYMLRGYDKNWHEWSTDRRAVYTNLAPGPYEFCIESYNPRIIGKAEPLRVVFKIRHPWWGLWYLQVISVVLLLFLMAIIIMKYVENEKQKHQKKLEVERKIAQLEMQALQALMNPHFIFNCVNNIQYFVLANDMDNALAYLSDFSKVVRQTLKNASFKLVQLEKEIDYLLSYLRLEQMRFPDKFDFKVSCGAEVSIGTIMFPPMLVQPFVENAIQHGFRSLERKGSLSVVFEVTEEDLLKITITDNGIGRPIANLKKALSMEYDRPHSADITENRIRLFNSPDEPGKYRVEYTDLTENQLPNGLKVELFLPLETQRK